MANSSSLLRFFLCAILCCRRLCFVAFLFIILFVCKHMAQILVANEFIIGPSIKCSLTKISRWIWKLAQLLFTIYSKKRKKTAHTQKKYTTNNSEKFQAKHRQSQNINETNKQKSEWALTFVYCLHCIFLYLF